ncbi:hypothetical protein [Ramlibacter sp.]|uniref:hypothetical protein n=1 Tax=Ramlibacter sp. TaxID=1917967 RepID=UPI003D14D6EA
MTTPSQLRQTRTYVELGLSQPAYDEIAAKLRAAGYDHAFGADGSIDLHGLAAVLDLEAEPRVQVTITPSTQRLSPGIAVDHGAGVEHLVPVHPEHGADWDSLYHGTEPPWPVENGYAWKRVVLFDAPGVSAITPESIAEAVAGEKGRGVPGGEVKHG